MFICLLTLFDIPDCYHFKSNLKSSKYEEIFFPREFFVFIQYFIGATGFHKL